MGFFSNISNFSGLVNHQESGTLAVSQGADGFCRSFGESSVDSYISLMNKVYIPFSQIVGDEVKSIDGIAFRKRISVNDYSLILIPFLAGLIQVTEGAHIVFVVSIV